MSYKDINIGSLVSIDNGSGELSFDIVIEVEYQYYKNWNSKREVPYLFYTALNPHRGFNSYMPKFKLASI